ncbi:MAG: exodeoxyribonuclease VII small subunit [Candidatus Omnitrophota bacterium]|jgi:exodeoxyribonuclease VII small subunit
MVKTADFEKSLKRLERIVEELEDGNLSLDEALKKYEEGIGLAKGCSKMLQEAKNRVEKLVKKEGSLITEDFQPEKKNHVSGED